MSQYSAFWPDTNASTVFFIQISSNPRWVHQADLNSMCAWVICNCLCNHNYKKEKTRKADYILAYFVVFHVNVGFSLRWNICLYKTVFFFLNQIDGVLSIFNKYKNKLTAVIFTYINTKIYSCLSDCLFIFLYTIFSAILKPVGIPYGTNVLFAPGKVLKQTSSN